MRHAPLRLLAIILLLCACSTRVGAEAADGAAASTDHARHHAEPATLHFAALGGIRDWRALDDGGLLIEGRNHAWFIARFMGTCPDLRLADTIGFVTDPSGDLTRFDAVLVRGQRCQFRSLERVDAEVAKTLR